MGLEKLEAGFSGQRIYQDLVAEHGFPAKYSAGYVARLRKVNPLPFRRMEVAAGEEAQVDFGKSAPIIDEDGRRRRTWVLRVVLSHSRKAYSEAVYRQRTDDFIRCLENAFLLFSGVPRTLVPDNIKAAVIRADWSDPDCNPKLMSFCEHYATVPLPTKPRTPRNKGKVKRGVGYVQDNALIVQDKALIVLYRSIFDVVRDFLHDEAKEGQQRTMNRYLKPDLLIIDDFGMKQLPKRNGKFLFELVMRR